MPPETPERPTSSFLDFLRQRRRLALGAAALAVLAVTTAILLRPSAPGPVAESADVPDFSAMTDVKARKHAFFEFLAPMVEDHNEWVREQRAALASMRAELDADRTLARDEADRVAGLARRYRVSLPPTGIDVATIDELLRHCDGIPPPLALAQAASESAWGTSRFARQGNNYFGEWCFEAGCGLVPSSRGAGKTHEVEVFATVEDSVDSYFRNLNRVDAYRSLRKIRADARAAEAPIEATALAAGLERYSELGHEYVEDIRSIISFNRLETRYGFAGNGRETGARGTVGGS